MYSKQNDKSEVGGENLLDEFFSAMDNFFRFVRRHCGIFYWICWVYIIALLILQTELEFDETSAVVALIPINLLTWPVFWETRKIRMIPLPVRRTVWALPVVSTLLPLLLFFDYL